MQIPYWQKVVTAVSLPLLLLTFACGNTGKPVENYRFGHYEIKAGEPLPLPDGRRKLLYSGGVADTVTITYSRDHPEDVGKRFDLYPFTIEDTSNPTYPDKHKYQIGGGTSFENYTFTVLSVSGTETPETRDDKAVVEVRKLN